MNKIGFVLFITHIIHLTKCEHRPLLEVSSVTGEYRPIYKGGGETDGDFEDEEIIGNVLALTDEQKTMLLESHNDYRKMEGSSNMRNMTWDDEVARWAELWGEKCIMKHGYPYPRDEAPYGSIGQNLHAHVMSWGILLTRGVNNWFDENSDYDFDSLSCSSGRACGHYTQLVWSESFALGCAMVACPYLKEVYTPPNMYLLVCNYSPTGNVYGRAPYKKGDDCTQCDGGQSWCDDGLCVDIEDCNGECECRSSCQNNALFDPVTCSCECSEGWMGTDCSIECKDYDDRCVDGGWPPPMCGHPMFGQYVMEGCPHMCGVCV